MQKYKAKKEVVEQITSKLQANKNIFYRGDFDEYKIKNMGVAPDGYVYNLDNPTEKFYYDLKMKFAENDKTDDIEKSHKYIRRWKMNNGEWRYEYPKGFDKKIHSFRDVTTALTNKTTEIKGVQPLTTEKQIDAELERLTKLSEEGKLTCPALGNANIYIEDMTTEHAEKTNNVFRTADAKIHKLQYLSFVEPILKNGILYMKSRKYNHTWTLDKVPERERTTYGILNKVTYTDTRHNNKQVTCGLEIVVAWDAERKRFVFSFIDRQIKKSLLNSKDIKTTAFEVGQVGACNTEALSTTNSIIAHPLNLSSKNVIKSLTISDKLFRLWQRRLSPELQKEMEKYVDEHSRVYSLFSGYKDVCDIKGYPKGLDLENNILLELGDTYFVVSCGGDWQDEKLVKFSIGEDDKLKAEVVDKCDKEDKRVLKKKLAYIINPETINKSLTYSGHKLQGRTKLYGMDISIENKKGSYRSGVDSDGHKWKTFMNYDYGYIRGTVGVDKDHLDCVSPDTKILMSDYTEKCASDIKIGDELIGIKIETQRYHQRKQIITKVLNVKKGVDDMLDITLSNGVKLRTTKGHLHYYFQGNTRDKYWKRADELKIGDKLVMIFNHKDLEESDDYKKGYLYGAYTGDGCYSFDESKQVYCDIRKGVDFIDVIHRVKKYWNDLGLETVDIKIEKPRQTNSLLADGRRIVSKMDLAILSIRGINKIRFIKSIFEKNPNSFEWCRGYIAGLFDTDGCLNCRHEFQITQTKNQDEFMKFTIFCMGKLGYKAVQRNNELKINTDYMADNVTMEFTQLIKPILEKKRNFLGQTYRYEPLEITDIKPYKGDFVAIQTDEQTYIANGIVTHNCYIGPDKKATKVYVIHQNNPVTHKYDEDKCMLCFESADAAKKAYMKQYDRPGFFGSMETLTIEQFKSFVFSKQGKRIHKSFDITITDITENNKDKKIAQTEKILKAIYDNKTFVVKHIKADNSTKYNDITLRIKHFDEESINKAIRNLSFTLDSDLLVTKGETFTYKAQEELTNRFVKELTNKTKAIYEFVINYFGLPEMRIVQKSNLTYKGKTLYNPETGEPISKTEWKKFIGELEKFLNRNYNGIGDKIVLSAESLGRILNRLSKTNTLDAIKKMKLSDLKYKQRTFDWISNTAKNMTDTFGESLTRDRQARVQAAIDSVAQRITHVQDDMRDSIQQIIIDGVKDRQSKSKISQNLFDKCVGMNRDFQRIADTEIQNNSTSAYIHEEVHNTEDGEKVYFQRFEIIDDNTCAKCRKLKGKIVLWSDMPLESENIKDPYADKAIWEGKEEGIPFSVSHPWCRGCWVRYYPEE